MMLRAGDIVLTKVQFTDTFEIKRRPALVLFQQYGNIVIAGITSNLKMKGIPLSKKEGMVRDSVIKLNYIFTVSEDMIDKVLFHLGDKKKRRVFDELVKLLSSLKK